MAAECVCVFYNYSETRTSAYWDGRYVGVCGRKSSDQSVEACLRILERGGQRKGLIFKDERSAVTCELMKLFL